MMFDVTCSRCGFVAFVPQDQPVHLTGWRIPNLRDGRGVCPACIEDERTVLVRTTLNRENAPATRRATA
jgi:hypothetical protein